MRDVSPETQARRWWVHRSANVLDKLPRRVQSKARTALREITNAPDARGHDTAVGEFKEKFEAMYLRATASLTTDADRILASYDVSAEHRVRLRTTNPIESTFATVRLHQPPRRPAPDVPRESIPNSWQDLNHATCHFVDRKENVLRIAPPGVGEPHLAPAPGHRAERRGYDVLFLTDLGSSPFHGDEPNDLDELVRLRHERRSMLITSHRTADGWAEISGDPLLAPAAVDRLRHQPTFSRSRCPRAVTYVPTTQGARERSTVDQLARTTGGSGCPNQGWLGSGGP